MSVVHTPGAAAARASQPLDQRYYQAVPAQSLSEYMLIFKIKEYVVGSPLKICESAIKLGHALMRQFGYMISYYSFSLDAPLKVIGSKRRLKRPLRKKGDRTNLYFSRYG